MSESAFILVVESDIEHAETLVESLRSEGHLCRMAHTADEAIESIRVRHPDVIAADYELACSDGASLLGRVKQITSEAEFVVLVSESDETEARKQLATDAGVRISDFLVKPISPETVLKAIDVAIEAARYARQQKALQEQADRRVDFEGIITVSAKMIRVIKLLTKAAESKLTVLILGDSGTGKELAARAVHRNSPRKNNPYRAINCAGLHENLLESLLFGHVKGAFTGATSDHKGLFEVVDGGTLFLDEVGDMPLPMQAKLLRTLENGEILPVGSNDVRKVDVRIIAATRQDLRDMVDKHTFRDDLFYRLHQAAIRIPPLRERREDIPLLVDHFLRDACDVHDKHVESVSPDVIRKLTAHQWPGNVRELKSVVDAMVVYAETSQLETHDLPEAIRGGTDLAVAALPTTAGLTMDQMEKVHITNTLKLNSGNREKTAKMLGIGARTLYRKLREYGL